jgi:hypothetical protein
MCYFVAIILMLLASAVHSATHTVATRAQLLTAIGAAADGDIIVVSNGIYTDWAEIIVPRTSDGTAAQRVTMRAQTPGGVILRGQNAMRLVVRAAFWDFNDMIWENVTALDARDTNGVSGIWNVDGAQDVTFNLIVPHCSKFSKSLKLLKRRHENASPGSLSNPPLASVCA